MGSYRISKILGELNIGLDTASDFLKEKGHDALKNRNAKIDQDQYDALVDQFASDKSKKVKSEELPINVRKIYVFTTALLNVYFYK